jgi:hypothetical protein
VLFHDSYSHNEKKEIVEFIKQYKELQKTIWNRFYYQL